jgi:Zn finger protein HypA/HybF involved in hydrogenase expression
MDEPRYLWCELCGHAYTEAAWTAAGNRCPNCGAPLINARPWDELRAAHPEYPTVPVEGREYAM